MSATAGKMESYEKETADPANALTVWKRELDAAFKHYERYWEISAKTLKRYRDERVEDINPSVAKLNFFWSNTQVLKSTLYTKPPKVDVARLFDDYTDDVARVAGIILERLLNHDLEKDSSDFDVAVRQSIDDWLIVGEGQVWYRYDVETEEAPMMGQPDPMTGQPMPMTGEDGEPMMEESIVNEDALSDYVYWRDFLCSPARTWGEVRWVARRVYMTRDALVERFGEEIGEQVPVTTRSASQDPTSKASDGDNDDPWATAEVWEIWCKTNRMVHWVVRSYDEFLDQREDPLQLERFFPCPQPMLANMTNDTLIPRADYSMARDQYQQIDVLTSRLRILIDACKVRGVFDKDAAPALQNVLQGPENKMIPVDNWAMFAEKGGLKGVMDYVPLDMIVTVVQRLREDMAAQKQELYETLGIADIMRGATRASETATAQQIKAQFGSTRLQFKQFEVARFVRDAQRIKADIICRHYQPDTMKQRSNIMNTPDAQHADQAIAMLKDAGMVQYRLNVEADSMAAMDWANEREARTQFLGALGGFIQQVMPLAQAKPESVPVLMQLMQWGLAGFRVGKEIEGVLDQALNAMGQQPQGPSPEQKAKEQAEIAKTQSEAERNKASAVKSLSDAHTNRIQTASDIDIERAMGAQVPQTDSAQEASYGPPPQPGVM